MQRRDVPKTRFDLPEDFEVRVSKLVVLSRVEVPRHKPVRHGLNHLGLQEADLQAEPGGGHSILYITGRPGGVSGYPRAWYRSVS